MQATLEGTLQRMDEADDSSAYGPGLFSGKFMAMQAFDIADEGS
jgi:hypothetical protein